MDINPTARELLLAFRHFGRASWQLRSVDGVKSSELMTLFCIKQHTQPESPGMKVSEISGIMEVTSPTVTQLINSMVEQGLVERATDPSDRRAVRVKLTAKGQELADKRAAMMAASFNGLVEHLGEEQSKQLAELLNKACGYYNDKSAKNKERPPTSGGGSI